MVNVASLSPAQGRLRVDADDAPDFRLRAVLAGRATIDVGDEGPGVRFIQQILRRLGSGIEADGDFGPKTRAAVEQFQRRHSLRPTGQIDDNTLARLLARDPNRPIRLGETGVRVERVERDLARLGYLDRAEIGGAYDAETARAVRLFRRDQPELNDRTSGDVVGTPTRRELAQEVRALQHAPERGRVQRTDERVALDQRTRVAARGATPIGRGDDRRAIVSNVQRHLEAAGYDPKNTRGEFDERTEAALKAFQRRSGLPATGVVDGETWSKLRGSIILADSATSPPQARGERSDAVLQSERLLQRAGYDPGRVDGKFDLDTVRAMRRFEREHPRARDDGRIDTRELAMLKRAAENGLVRPIAARLTPGSEFGLQDAEGAPANDGRRYHAGKDWFAPGGTAVRSPVSGEIVEVKPSRGNSGQIFGGVVKVRGEDGKVWVFRHVDPTGVREGQRVGAGDLLARVTDWTGGPDHAHIELWRTLRGGYDFENMIDPMDYLKKFL